MSEPNNGHHGQDASKIPHMPDPSVWPIVAGVAVLLLGAALVWWVADDGSSFTGPALGAAAAVTLVAVAGWAYEDGRMRKAAEEHESHERGESRYTQVMTFAIPEGKLDEARAGVMAALDDSNSTLHNLAGFLDLRISVSPAATGPSQVLVETTWSAREDLASYEETRQTLLDLLQGHTDEVAPGTVQVFDMEVVRDTKDVSLRIGMGATATLLGAFLIGGVAVGWGITLFEGDAAVAENGGNGNGEPPPPQGFDGTIVSEDILFDIEEFSLPPGVEVTLSMDNRDDGIPHNIAFYQSPTAGEGGFLQGCTDGCEPTEGDADVRTPIEPGLVIQTFTFTTPSEPGEYGFLCEVHPTTMVGVMTIEEGAPLPGEDPEPGGGGTEVIATDNEFSVDTIEAAAGSEVTLALTNDGIAPHNIHFYTEQGGESLGDDAQTAILDGGTSETITFTAPAEPGTYFFVCDVHPTEMTGDFIVQ